MQADLPPAGPNACSRFRAGPTPDTADAMVASAHKKGQAVRGHTLIWHDSAPAWVYEITEQVTKTQYITTVVQHFGNRINI